MLKELPEYLDEFCDELKKQIIADNERWGDTWKERGLVWEGKEQEQRFFNWVTEKLALDWGRDGKPFPWVKAAGEAMIGYVREKYMKE